MHRGGHDSGAVKHLCPVMITKRFMRWLVVTGHITYSTALVLALFKLRLLVYYACYELHAQRQPFIRPPQLEWAPSTCQVVWLYICTTSFSFPSKYPFIVAFSSVSTPSSTIFCMTIKYSTSWCANISMLQSCWCNTNHLAVVVYPQLQPLLVVAFSSPSIGYRTCSSHQ